MKFASLILICAAAAYGEKLMTGTTEISGVFMHLETRLEPGNPPITKHGGGSLTENNVLKRHICNFDNKTYFGYDLAAEKLTNGQVRLKFSPLSMPPAQMTKLFNQVQHWNQLALPTGSPATLDVRPGDTVALDLFVNPSTGQKVTEYITVKSR